MAYNVVPTQITGDSWTAGKHNTYVRDNFKAGIPDVFTAVGEIAYASGIGGQTASVLSPGNPRGQYRVNSSGDAPECSTQIIGCDIREVRISPKEGYGSPPEKVIFTSEYYDPYNFWGVGDPDAIILPWDGVYQINVNLKNFRISGSSHEVITVMLGPDDKQIDCSDINLDDSPVTGTFGNHFSAYVGKYSAGDDLYLKLGVSGTGALGDVYYMITYLGVST